jgi:hypothetical protein
MAESVTKLWSKAVALWRAALPLIVFVIVVLVALILFGVIPSPRAGEDQRRRKPYEYAYLDRARVDAYLGQLNEGDVTQETRTDVVKGDKGVKLEVKALGEASGSISTERTASVVVSLSEADNFFKLEKELRAEDSLTDIPVSACCSASARGQLSEKLRQLTAAEPEVQLRKREENTRSDLDHSSEGVLEHLPLGTIVKLEGVSLAIPPYLTPYPSLRYAALRYIKHDPVLGAAPLFDPREAELATEEATTKERKRFIEDAGPNPRLPFSTKVGHLTVVIPARYSYITGDPSLYGTSLTVVGELVHEGRNFGDAASEVTYLPALMKASPAFLEDIGVKHAFLKRYSGRSRASALHANLFRALQRSLTFNGTSVEVIPLAIYD